MACLFPALLSGGHYDHWQRADISWLPTFFLGRNCPGFLPCVACVVAGNGLNLAGCTVSLCVDNAVYRPWRDSDGFFLSTMGSRCRSGWSHVVLRGILFHRSEYSG